MFVLTDSSCELELRGTVGCQPYGVDEPKVRNMNHDDDDDDDDDDGGGGGGSGAGVLGPS